MEWGQQPGLHGEKGGQAEDSRSLPGNLDLVSLSLLGNGQGHHGAPSHWGFVQPSPCLRLEDEFLQSLRSP